MAESPPTPRSARAKYMSLTRWYGQDDQATIDAKRELNEANLAAAIKRVVDDSPPLTHEQRDRLAQLLRGGA